MLSSVAADGHGPVNVTARVGSEVIFDCIIHESGEEVLLYREVDWVYQDTKSGKLIQLTENRISLNLHRRASFQPPENYRLKIDSVNQEDEGYYECVVYSPQRKRVEQVFLKVTEY
uniref:Ig-like domain-containing protein n=1 Tax=Cuerna arida TaxID=1464854 RepID=A0A1B6GP96_9HEMI